MSLAVQIPRLHVALPEGTSADVQGLGPMENVPMGAHKGSRTSLLIVPLDPTQPPPPSDSPSSRTDVAVNIGDIEVARGTDLKVDLNGTVHVESGAKTQVTGQIHLLKGGLLNLQGRNFEVEGGTVTFTGGEPSNPEIVVKANWTAQDGTIVSANFVGPLKTGKVTLSSQPPLPKQEIVELLLYGTSSGQQAQTPSGSTENTAIATAGGEAAQPLNHALNQLGLGAVTAKVDTSESATPKPEVEVQVAKGISVQLAYVLGVPPPGVNPDTTLVTVDWRFLSKWSLESTVGNLGTSIFDLLWQSRY
jgi:translocation and assembly module TamB